MEEKPPAYLIHYDCEAEIISFSGKLHLVQREKAFHEILSWFDLVIKKEPPKVLLDFSKLEYLNSLGISIISKFIIRVRDRRSIHVVVKASNEVTWQTKSLVNLKRIMPSLEFVYIDL